MRRTVSVEMLLTTPSSMSLRASSEQSHWERDLPASSGRSQAIFTRCIATSGGEKRPPSPAWLIGEPTEPFLLETLGPFVDESSTDANPPRDLGDGNTLGEQENDSPSFGQTCTNSRRALPGFKSLPFFRIEQKGKIRFAGHRGLLGTTWPIC